MNKRWWEDFACWLCDYGVFAFAILLILLLGLWRWQSGTAQALPTPLTPFASPTASVGEFTSTPPATPFNTIPAPASSSPIPASTKPDFVLVFLPVDWKSSQSAFQDAAQNQADAFIHESQIGDYFTPKIVILQDGPQNVSLSSDTLLDDILEFGLQKQAGDRYIGLTDGDLSLNGSSDVTGWTSGGQVAVGEAGIPYVVAHEMGHTFGLCDEYDYADWSRENADMTGGCPNPYPADCSRSETDHANCPGSPTTDGRNSIMGPAGLDGAYGYNTACMNQLKNSFKALSGLTTR